MQVIVTIRQKASAQMTADHTPSIAKISGSTSTLTTSKKRVRMNEISAEIAPLFKAVKSDEPKILNPIKI